MELLQYWRILRKRLWVIVLLVLVGIASTTYYTLQQPAVYESSETLLLNPSVPSALVPYLGNTVGANLADSYAELMRSVSFGESVSKELPFPLTASEVVGSINTSLVANTLFFKITGSASTPERAQQLVSTVVKVFLSANAAQQQAQTNQGPDSLHNQVQDRLTTNLKYFDDQIKSYQDEIKTLDAQAPSAARDDQLIQLRGQLVTLQQAETEAATALGQLDASSTPLNTAIVIDAARPGTTAAVPLSRNLLLAGAVSLVLGLGVALLLNYLDYTVRSPEYLEQVLGLTPMAVVGVVGGGATGSGSRKRRKRLPANETAGPAGPKVPAGRLTGHNLITLEHPRSPDAESFRVLRTNLQFSSLGKPIRSLVVTSGAPAEGKSFTAANLAIVMAQAGKRVILVDADLRRPSVHKLFGLSNTAGLTNLVLNENPVSEQAVHLIPEVPNLFVVPSGPLPPNPSELLDSLQTTQVMMHLAHRADIVIYDTPPVTVVTDPAILAARVDAVILVVSANSTRRDVVERVKKILQTVGVKTVIPVLNRVKLQDIHGYYYYYHSDGNYTLAETVPVVTNGHDAHANGKDVMTAAMNGAGLPEDGITKRSASPADGPAVEE